MSDVIGSGNDAHRIVRVGNWTLTVPGETGTDPEIPDTALAQRLGMEVKHLRELSARHESDGNISPRKVYGEGESNKSDGTTYSARGRGRPGIQRFYNEADALFLVTRAGTAKAIKLTKEMILVYMLARRGLIPSVPASAPTIPAEVLAALATVPIIAAQMESLTALVKDNAARLGSLEQNIASGVVGAERGGEITRRLYAASLRATGGDKTRAKSVRGRWVQQLRNAAQFNGPRSAWRNLPRTVLAVVEAHLDAIEREADHMAKTATPPPVTQTTFPFDSN